jgi:integrase
MSALRQQSEEYLALRRALGYALRQEGRMLASFIDDLESHGTTRVSIEAALRWATAPSDASPTWWAKRLGVVRGFARYVQSTEPTTEVPPTNLVAHGVSRTTPYLYSPGEIAALMEAATRLAAPLRAATFECFIGLMAATGLRTGEAMALDRDDVDLADHVLTVRCSKGHKTRLVPLDPTTTDALWGYAQRRDQLCPHPSTSSFFVSGAGTRLNHTNASTTFAGLLDAAGLTWSPGRRRPRLYDLRHSFAVATLVGWYRDGVDVAQRLTALSTYMGHDKPSATYWYVEAAPELMALAATRLDRFLGERS